MNTGKKIINAVYIFILAYVLFVATREDGLSGLFNFWDVLLALHVTIGLLNQFLFKKFTIWNC
jgi:hypothetical protein